MEKRISSRYILTVFVLLFSLLGWQAQANAADTSTKPPATQAAAININTASAGEIAAALNGVGEKRAEAIVAYREQNGPFKSLADLQNVKGIGEKVVEKNAPLIKF